MCSAAAFLLLSLAVTSQAYPTLPGNAKRPDAEEGLVEAASLSGGELGPLEEVSKVLDRYARQLASTPRTPSGPKKWSPLHRAVLRGALQVTKQLLGYDGWTPNHLELLKGEQEILLEHVADEQGDTENRIGDADKEEVKNEGAEKMSEGATNDEGGAPQDPPAGGA